MHFLHLEDSDHDAELIHAMLRCRWPDCDITVVKSERSFREAIQRADFDLVLSDYSLPGFNGLTALGLAQTECPQKPFIYLSGTIGEERAIEALKRGASDYIIKDRPARLIPAIETAISQAEREQAREQTQRRLREQASLLDKAREAMCVTDLRRRITFWNASAERLYGCPAAEAVGRDLRELLYQGEEVAFEAAYGTALADGEWRGDLKARGPGAEPLMVESFWSLVADEAGSSQSIFIIDTDVTDRKRLEAEITHARGLETIGLLAGGIAHDMNNVLAPILTSVDLLGHLVTRPQDRELLEILEASVQHGVELVRQLLAFAGGGEAARTELAIENLVTSVHRLLRNALRNGIALHISLPKDLALIRADATQLRQVLLNLCINARDAMPQGGSLTIAAENEDVRPGTTALLGEVRPGPHLRLRVTDTGTGIPPAIIPRLFEPFFSTKKAGKGTGLGLANVGRIVTSHGGFIRVESTPGLGTSFSLYFPAIVEVINGENAPVTSAVPAAGSGEGILVIEDDDAVRTVLEVILTTRGYRVFAARDGEEGLEELRRHPSAYALITTDLLMPETTGLDVVEAVRGMPSPPPIIVLSGLSRDDQDAEPRLRGVEFLAKPFTVDSLVNTVRRVLDQHPANSDRG